MNKADIFLYLSGGTTTKKHILEYFGLSAKIKSMSEIYDYLSQYNIPFEKFEHEPVHTIGDLEKLPKMNAAITKNLFLRDKSNKYILATVEVHKSVDLKKLGELLNAKKLGFASADQMMECLGVEPGAVTLLGLMHDTKHAVEVVIDSQLWEKNEALQCHPLVNSESLVLTKEALERFFDATGHLLRILDIPARQS